MLITAGERDPIAPAPVTSALADYFTRQKAAVQTEWHSGGHDIRQNEIEAIKAFLSPYPSLQLPLLMWGSATATSYSAGD